VKTKILAKTAASAVIFPAICMMAALSAPHQTAETQTAPWYSIVPPLITIVLAFLTRNVLLSIAVAVITGGLLTTLPSDPTSLSAIIAGLKTTVFYPVDTLTNMDNLKILAFVPPVFAMVEIIIVSGGFKAILQKLLPLIKTQKSAQAATALMGLIYFIDDYSNAVIVGSSMRPVTDRFGISREKLAFLVDATTQPAHP
jgi:Na+/H+ antiporter NhaC